MDPKGPAGRGVAADLSTLPDMRASRQCSFTIPVILIGQWALYTIVREFG